MITETFELKPDFMQALARYEAWWECAVIDRPLVCVSFPKPASERRPLPVSRHGTLRERWMDADYVADCADARLSNVVHFADALPVAYPNLGPEVFSALYGCELEFGESTVWSQPVLHDWSDAALTKLTLDFDNIYFKALYRLTDALLERGCGRFIVGYTDLHGGGDAIAAFRDPQQLLLDTIENPGAVKRLCDRITRDFLRVYDIFHDKLSAAGMPSTSWCPATCKGKYHIPSNDFSCMIAAEAFEELFIPGIIRECQHMDRCLYHLDGPQALRYLDLLLDIPEIDAIQWVPTSGNNYWADSIEVYRRIQQRGKALQLHSVPVEDLPLLFTALKPEGVWISSVPGVSCLSEAESVVAAVARWGR